MPPDAGLLGAVEGGGTQFVCGVSRSVGSRDKPSSNSLERDLPASPVIIPTTTPDETCARILEFFRGYSIESLGIAMFGPLELSPQSSNFGSLLRTPKPGWSGVPVLTMLRDGLQVPAAIDTDVNAAALAEHVSGAAVGCDPTVYITVGTGVGVGVFIRGGTLHGLLHPELGHLPVPRWRDAHGNPDTFEGTCPFHGRCVEGLVSGTALWSRFGRDPASVRDDDPAWDAIAAYLGDLLVAVVLALSPQRIVMGGGVMERATLFPKVRASLRARLNGYVPRAELDDGLEQYVVPRNHAHAGLEGAFLLAKRALRDASSEPAHA